MAIIGALFKAGRGIHRSAQLPDLIEAAERRASTPILDTISGVERFDVAVAIQDALLVRQAKTGPVSQAERKHYIRKLRKEYQMAKSDLESQPANRAEVAALAIGLKELALNLDEQVSRFRQQSEQQLRQHAAGQKQELGRFVGEAQQALRQQESRHNAVLSGFESQGATLLQECTRNFEADASETIRSMRLQIRLLWTTVVLLLLTLAALAFLGSGVAAWRVIESEPSSSPAKEQVVGPAEAPPAPLVPPAE
jgi:hypothetical protein